MGQRAAKVDREGAVRYDLVPAMILKDRGFPMPRSSKPLGMFRKAQTSAKPKQAAGLGALPEWNLEDLYPSMELPAFASDLAKAAAECKSLQRRI